MKKGRKGRRREGEREGDRERERERERERKREREREREICVFCFDRQVEVVLVIKWCSLAAVEVMSRMIVH